MTRTAKKSICRLMGTALLVLLANNICTTHAGAGEAAVSEVRFGLAVHNVEGSGNEDGADLTGELLLTPFGEVKGADFWSRFLTPKIHVGGSLNLQGHTNQLYLGATWRQALTDDLFAELSLGAALHDGPLADEGVASYGCRMNFRESVALGWRLDAHWRLIASLTHMSNANLCARNRGLTNTGLKLGYAFD